MHRAIPPEIEFRPIINGVETIEDMAFLEHFVLRSSKTLPLGWQNQFTELLLPLALENVGLMHSVLALSGSVIDFIDTYGAALLATVPNLTLTALKRRILQHKCAGLRGLRIDIREQEHGYNQQSGSVARYGHMLCLLMQSMVEQRASGEHWTHLRAYHSMIRMFPIKETPLTKLIDERFQSQNAIGKLTYLPQGLESLTGLSDDSAICSFKYRNGLFYYWAEIYIIRNKIRSNMAIGRDPAIDWNLRHAAAEIETKIREWVPPSCNTDGGFKGALGLLYRQMTWLYLWRSIYPPTTSSWLVHPKITEAVDEGLILLAGIPHHDRTQAILLPPAFIIGCAAFNAAQRSLVRKSIEVIKSYTKSRNAVRAVEVLEEVWRRMDHKDERSWDWERTAHEMGIDFLLN
jgi:hypothetical protein